MQKYFKIILFLICKFIKTSYLSKYVKRNSDVFKPFANKKRMFDYGNGVKNWQILHKSKTKIYVFIAMEIGQEMELSTININCGKNDIIVTLSGKHKADTFWYSEIAWLHKIFVG